MLKSKLITAWRVIDNIMLVLAGLILMIMLAALEFFVVAVMIYFVFHDWLMIKDLNFELAIRASIVFIFVLKFMKHERKSH